MPALATKNREPKSAAIGRVTDFNLADLIRYRRDAVRNRRWMPMGYLVGITFNLSDESAYGSPEVQEKWKRSNAPHRNWLRLLWHKDHGMPVMGDARNNVFVFPFGLPELPPVFDPSAGAPHGWVNPSTDMPVISQDPLDYVNGYVAGRDGTKFLCIQPIESIALVAANSMFVFRAYTDNATGTKPAFLFTPDLREAHIVGGFLAPTGR